ncbi:hypothetical protein SARC_18229, partial [Sphaeroforma arctica JP610]
PRLTGGKGTKKPTDAVPHYVRNFLRKLEQFKEKTKVQPVSINGTYTMYL